MKSFEGAFSEVLNGLGFSSLWDHGGPGAPKVLPLPCEYLFRWNKAVPLM